MEKTRIESRQYKKVELDGEMVHFFEYIDEFGTHVSDYPPYGHLIIEARVGEKNNHTDFVAYINGVEFVEINLWEAENKIGNYLNKYTFFDFPIDPHGDYGFGGRSLDLGDDEVVIVDDRKLSWRQYANDLDIPKEWENASYGNDACPSFTYKGYQIFHDHPDPNEREIPEWKRFHVILKDKYGQPTGWCFDTDDFNEVLETVKIPFHKQVEKFKNTDELDFFEWPADLNIPKEWEDTSWIQDLTPSYEFNGWKIHIDHPDPEKSALKMEYGSKDDGSAFERFYVFPSHDEEVLENTLETNNFDEVIKFVSKKQS